MKRFAVILTVICAWLGCLGAQSYKMTAYKGKVPDAYHFWLVTPTDTAGPKPVIIFLHGASLCGNDLERVKRYGTLDAIERGREIDAYVIAPQNPGGSWSPRKINSIYRWVKENHDVDSTRVYVIGMSLGGYGTADYAATYPDEVAAAIAVCGGATVRDLSGLARLPFWLVHGTADRAVNVQHSDRISAAVKQSADSVSRIHYDRVPGMNHSQPARMFYMPQVYEWLFAHSLSDEGRPAAEPYHITVDKMRGAYNGLSSKGNYSASKKSSQSKKRTRKKATGSKKKATRSRSRKK